MTKQSTTTLIIHMQYNSSVISLKISFIKCIIPLANFKEGSYTEALIIDSIIILFSLKKRPVYAVID